MKKRILFVGWDEQEYTTLKFPLKTIADQFFIVHAAEQVSAFKEIAKASLIEENPVVGIVFKRDFIEDKNIIAGLIEDFAREYTTTQKVCSIGLLRSKHEKRKFNSERLYTIENQWVLVKNLLKAHIR